MQVLTKGVYVFNEIKEIKTCKSFNIQIYIAGPIEVAKQILRRESLVQGMCVTIEPTLYLYSGGEEVGYVVGFINYPNFPKSTEELMKNAQYIADILLNETYQQSYTLVSPIESIFVSKR